MLSKDLLVKINFMRKKIGKNPVRNNDFANSIIRNFPDARYDIVKSKSGMEMKIFTLDNEQATQLENNYMNRLSNYAAKECACISGIEAALGRKVTRQHPVGNYRIDAYDHLTNTAYEVDEYHHQRNIEGDAKRQREIESIINCRFVRISV